jgi:hypothetical protein
MCIADIDLGELAGLATLESVAASLEPSQPRRIRG